MSPALIVHCALRVSSCFPSGAVAGTAGGRDARMDSRGQGAGDYVLGVHEDVQKRLQ